MPARKGPTYTMTHTHRDKIKNSNILSALIDHAEGKREMSGSQVQAGLGLMKKIMPDLAAQQFVDGEGNDVPASISIGFKSVES